MRTFLRLLSLLQPFLGQISLSVLFGILTICAGVGLLGTSAFLIASASLHPSVGDLQVAIVGVRFFGISRGVFRYLERWVSHSVNLKLLSAFRSDFYKRIEPRAPANLLEKQSGDVLERVMGDLEVLENFYVRVIAPAVVALVMTIGMSLFVGGFISEIGMLLAVGLILNGFIVPVIATLFTRRITQTYAIQKASFSSGIVEFLQGLEDLQSHGVEKRWLARLFNFDQETALTQNRLVQYNGLINGINLLLMNLTILAGLILTVPQVDEGRMSGVTMAVILLLISTSFEATANLPTAALNLNSSLEAAKRLFALGFEEQHKTQSVIPMNNGANQVLTFKNVSFSYGLESETILRGISFQLGAGQKKAIVGISGSGKTTLLNLLQCFWYPKTGTIQMDGININSMDSNHLRRQFGVISQSVYIFDQSLRENLQLAKPGATDEELENALMKAGLQTWLENIPDGLDTWLGEHGQRMSAGERQRVALARVFLMDPPFLLLDEPTANLDPINEVKLFKTIAEVFREKGCLLITHRLDLLKDMDEILVLQNGCIQEKGNFLELLVMQGLFKEMSEIHQDELADDLIQTN